MHIAILGTGDVGRALAAGLQRHGHDITVGTRDPSKQSGWTCAVATFAEAAAGADLVVLAVGFHAAEAVCQAIRTHVSGKTLIDATNPLRFGDGPPELSVSGDDSAGQRIQAWLPEAHVVKAWNIVGNQHMIDPAFAAPPTMFIAGDDGPAVAEVTHLLHEVGWQDVVCIGGIEASRYLEPLAMVWIRVYGAAGNGRHAMALLRV